MNSNTAAKLIALNREFYDRFGASFSATRQRLQPGVKRILETFHGNEDILDLGCGNGEFARALAKHGHRGSYLGLDFSLPLLREAKSELQGFSARFMEVDLTRLPVISDQLSVVSAQWDVVTAFAVLHHIPGHEIRLNILKIVHELLTPGGRFILSNWQFLNSKKLRTRIQPWEIAAISRPALNGVEASEVDAGDYLLDWRNGGKGLRYVHHFTAEELSTLAEQAEFRVVDSFLSDGEGGKLGLYQEWQQA